jgi:integrase
MPHVASDSFAAVVRAYLASPQFAKLAEGTQVNYRHLLKLASAPDVLGALKSNEIRPALVQPFLDALADRPAAQLNAKAVLTTLGKWAIRRDLLDRSITEGCEIVGGGDGHVPWSDQQIATAIQHARPDLARVILVASNTGQRGSDLIKMAWSDLETVNGRLGINVTQRKTGLQLWVPFTQALAAALATWERRPAPLLLRDDGTPWPKRNDLSKAWERERLDNPQLVACRGLVLHGLRAAACVRLRRLGCSEAEITAMVGLSLPMVSRYCRLSVQKENAMAAVLRMDGTPWQQSEAR